MREGTSDDYPVKLVTLDPGHFHAALLQKVMYPQVSPVVHVYAPGGPEVDDHLKKIEGVQHSNRESHPMAAAGPHRSRLSGEDALRWKWQRRRRCRQ